MTKSKSVDKKPKKKIKLANNASKINLYLICGISKKTELPYYILQREFIYSSGKTFKENNFISEDMYKYFKEQKGFKVVLK